MTLIHFSCFCCCFTGASIYHLLEVLKRISWQMDHQDIACQCQCHHIQEGRDKKLSIITLITKLCKNHCSAEVKSFCTAHKLFSLAPVCSQSLFPAYELSNGLFGLEIGPHKTDNCQFTVRKN